MNSKPINAAYGLELVRAVSNILNGETPIMQVHVLLTMLVGAIQMGVDVDELVARAKFTDREMHNAECNCRKQPDLSVN